MCSSPKSASSAKVKNVSTSAFTNSELSDFVSIANAAHARKEEKKRVERERLKLEESGNWEVSPPT